MENVKKLGGQQFLKKLNFETIPNFGARQNLETKSDTRPDIKYGNLLGEVRRSNNLSSVLWHQCYVRYLQMLLLHLSLEQRQWCKQWPALYFDKLPIRLAFAINDESDRKLHIPACSNRTSSPPGCWNKLILFLNS